MRRRPACPARLQRVHRRQLTERCQVDEARTANHNRPKFSNQVGCKDGNSASGRTIAGSREWSAS